MCKIIKAYQYLKSRPRRGAVNFLISLEIFTEAAASSEISPSFLPLYLLYTLLDFIQGILLVNQTNFPNALFPNSGADEFTHPEEFQLHRKQDWRLIRKILLTLNFEKLILKT